MEEAELPESDRVMEEAAEYIDDGMDDINHIDFVPQHILPIAERVKEQPKESVILVLPDNDRIIEANAQVKRID